MKRRQEKKNLKKLLKASQLQIYLGDRFNGTGFVITGGYIITAGHVIRHVGDRGYSVGLRHAGKRVPITAGDVVYTVDEVDLAVLHPRIASQLPTPRKALVPQLHPPLNQEFDLYLVTHKGKWLSGKSRVLFDANDLLGAGVPTEVPFDTPRKQLFQPGTSGSPLVDRLGRAVCVAIYTVTGNGALLLSSALADWNR